MNILKLFRHQKDHANASVTPKIGQRMYRKGNDIVEMERCQSPSVVVLHLTRKSLVPVGSVTCMKKQLSGFFTELYTTIRKAKQDAFLLKCMTVTKPKRQRRRKNNSRICRSVSVQYKVCIQLARSRRFFATDINTCTSKVS